jgi:predicted nucleotidyltransferase
MKDKQKRLDEIVQRLRKAFADRLVSVILYGSAAVGDDDKQFSDLNILCVLRQVTMLELENAEPVFRWWRDLDNPAPLLVSEEEVLHSTDCFPIEFHDMKDHRKVLYGADIIENLEIDDRYYRARVEYELRTKLLRLRQKGAGVLHDKELLLRLMVDSVTTFLILGHHVLRLHGFDAPHTKREVLGYLESHFALRPDAFATLLDVREEKRRSSETDARGLYRQYLEGVEALAATVNRLVK